MEETIRAKCICVLFAKVLSRIDRYAGLFFLDFSLRMALGGRFPGLLVRFGSERRLL
jgi:hypothetical protein